MPSSCHWLFVNREDHKATGQARRPALIINSDAFGKKSGRKNYELVLRNSQFASRFLITYFLTPKNQKPWEQIFLHASLQAGA